MKVASVAFSKKKTKQEVSQEFCMTKQKIYNLRNVVQENKQPMGSRSVDQTPLDTVLIYKDSNIRKLLRLQYGLYDRFENDEFRGCFGRQRISAEEMVNYAFKNFRNS